MPTEQSDLGNPSFRLSSQGILGCVKWKVKANHHSLSREKYHKCNMKLEVKEIEHKQSQEKTTDDT